MSKAVLLAALTLAIGLVGSTAPVAAADNDDSGFAALHDKVRANGKVCFVDHFHVGTGAGTTKKQAMADAVRSWSEFVAFEYGGRWGAWSRAAGRTAQCSGSNGSSVVCNLRARPCRAGR